MVRTDCNTNVVLERDRTHNIASNKTADMGKYLGALSIDISKHLNAILVIFF